METTLLIAVISGQKLTENQRQTLARLPSKPIHCDSGQRRNVPAVLERTAHRATQLRSAPGDVNQKGEHKYQLIFPPYNPALLALFFHILADLAICLTPLFIAVA